MALIYDLPIADDRQHPVERDEIFVLPASQGQERLWFLDKLEPNSAVYNMSTALWLHGDLDTRILERVLLELSARHETLRTTFAVENDQLVQLIAAKPRVTLENINLQDLNPDDQATAVTGLGKELARRPFDLVRGPLLRTTLARLHEREHVLFLILHHSICDGWSFGVLFREFAALYDAFLADRPSPLPDLPIQYADYAHWQREWLAGEMVERQLACWQQHLAGAPGLLPIPTDHPRPLTQRYRGTSLSLSLSSDLVSELRTFSLREGVTLFMTLLAGWQVLLARYSGQDDIVVGVPYANRTQVETEGLIGFFVNTLALRTDLSGDPSFVELVRRVRETALGAYAHQDVPFEKVVEVLQPERNLGFSPVFQVQLVFQNNAPVCMRLPGLAVEVRDIDNGTAQFDLSLVLEEADGALVGQLVYNTDLFEKDTIERMIGHLQILLSSAAADPEQRISSLPILTDAERRLQLVTWNATEADFPAESRTHELFEAQAERTPDAPAVMFQDRQWSYRQLNEQANQVAHHLRHKGVGRGDLVGLCLDRSLEMVLGVLAVLKVGAAYVPLDPAYPRERLAFMHEDAALTFIITQSSVRQALPGVTTAKLVLDEALETLRREPSTNLQVLGNADDPAYVIYTSGSTGKPKGVVISHRALVNFLCTMQRSPGLRTRDTLVAVTSLSFDIAGLEIFLPLVTGARVVVAAQDVVNDGRRLGALLRRCGATVMQATPATWRMLLTANWPGQPGLVMLCGGEALGPDLARALLKCGPDLWNLYGPTETTVWSTLHRVRAEDERVSIGRPIGNTQVYVLDRASRPVPIGVAGELYIGGVGLAQGYLRRPELTAERFVTVTFGNEPGKRLYRTGDLVRWAADGNLEYLGRLDQQVKVRGHRIELGEIEAALRDLVGIRDAAVTAQGDMPGETRLAAYVVPRHKHEIALADVRMALRERLPDYMVPSTVVIVEALPLTPNGKLDRRALSALRPRPQGKPKNGYAKPISTIHHQLIQIWEELLDVQPIGITDNFFELGGHSLLAARMVERIERACRKRIPLATLFGEPTIEHLATVLLRQEGDAQEPKVIALQSAGAKRPFYFLHGDWEGGGFYTVAISRQLGAEQPFYVVSPHGVGGDKRVPRTIEAMATAHLKEIRAIQRQGPYMLGGFCTDGMVAFEMAQQLLKQGEEVDLLVLLDAAPAARRHRIRLVIEGTGRLARLNSDAKLDFYLRLCAYDARWQAFQALTRVEQARSALKSARRGMKELASRLLASGEAVVAGSIQTPPISRDLNGIYRWITAAYRPRRYPGHVAHFWAAEEFSSHKEHLHEIWSALAPNAEFHAIPGSHLTFITVHGDQVAREIAECVEIAQMERQAARIAGD